MSNIESPAGPFSGWVVDYSDGNHEDLVIDVVYSSNDVREERVPHHGHKCLIDQSVKVLPVTDAEGKTHFELVE